MSESKLIIALIVGIIVVKLFAVHYYIKVKTPKSSQDTDNKDEP